MPRQTERNRMEMLAGICRSLVVGVFAGVAGTALGALAGWIGAASVYGTLQLAVVLAIMVGMMHYWTTVSQKSTGDLLLQFKKQLASVQDRITETQGLVQLSAYNQYYPMPFGGDWALAPDAAVVLAREIYLNKPNTIVELGAGTSTILVGRILQQIGSGRLISLDHDPHWVEETRRHIRASGLEKHVEVMDAPLAAQSIEGKPFTWYTIPDSLRQCGDIDMLIVDGPPQSIDPEGLARYPALPMFHAQLSQHATIYIDDAKRPSERAMIAKWHQEYPGWKQETIDTTPGTCLMQRRRCGPDDKGPEWL